MMCPLTCLIVQTALKVSGQMNEYVEYHKKHCSMCMECSRNEYSTLPEKDRTDKGRSSK